MSDNVNLYVKCTNEFPMFFNHPIMMCVMLDPENPSMWQFNWIILKEF